jgi:TonB family protein
MVLVLIGAGWYGVSAFPLDLAVTGASKDTPYKAAAGASQSQPARDPRPTDVRPATARETALKQTIASAPDNAPAYLELAKLQEVRGALAEAESTLLALETVQPKLRGSYQALAAFYNRTGQFNRTIRALEQAAALEPSNAEGYQILATYYYEKAAKDPSLTPADKEKLLEAGLGATDRALAAEPEYFQALVYKNIMLRLKANLVTDPTERQALITEADALRARAMELQKKNAPPPPPPGPGRADGRAMPPPPPPPPPPIDGKAPVRVGSGIKQPTKLVDVKPVYPADARTAGISGVVIIEAVIDEKGDIRDARVLRSIPLLDQAALDAVRQWRFTPTLLNGAPVPVISTFSVNFSLQ